MKLSLKPQNVNEFLWYYEEPRHVTIVFEDREPLTHRWIKTHQVKIPWEMLKKSVERKYGYDTAK